MSSQAHLRVLIVEDRPADAELMLDELHRSGFDPAWRRVDNEADLVAALGPDVDVVLSDYDLPGFSGMRALEVLRQRHPDMPFILLSGVVGEEVAVRAMREGASDYILKDRMARLGQAVSQALARRRAQKELQEAQNRYQGLFEGVPIGLYRATPDGRFLDVNEALVKLLAYPDRATLLATAPSDLFVSPQDRAQLLARAAETGTAHGAEVRARRYDGGTTWLSINVHVELGEGGEVLFLEGSVEDISVRRLAEEALRERERFLSMLNDMTRASLESWDVKVMLQTLAHSLKEMFGADGCLINTWDEKRQVSEAIAAAGTAVEAYHKAVRPEPGEASITSAVVTSGRALAVEDYQNSPVVSRRIAASYPCRSVLGLPLRSEHYRLGAAVVTFDTPHSFTEEEIARGEQAARQVSLAIARARLAEEAERRAAGLAIQAGVTQAVLQTHDLDERLKTILGEVMRVLMAEYGAIILVEENTPRVRVSDGLSTSFWEALQGAGLEAMPEPARQEGLKAWASIPLHLPARTGSTEPEWLGTILIGSRDPHAIPQDRVDNLNQMCVPISLLIEHSRAHQRAEQRMLRLRSLQDIDLAITSAFDLRVVLNVLLLEATTRLSVDAAAIMLLNHHTLALEFASGRGVSQAPFKAEHMGASLNPTVRAALERRSVHLPNLSQAATEDRHLASLAKEGFVGYLAVPLVSKGQVRGVLELYHRTPLRPDAEWISFLDTLSTQAAVAIDNALIFDELQSAHIELAASYDSTLEGWGRALDLRDKETEGHARRVTETTLHLARRLGVPDADLEHIRRGALLHDMGKMGVPDAILQKPGPLDEEEWEVIRRHPTLAYEMLRPIAFLRPALDIPYAHHEKWDGTGYPRGLKGEQIPLAARIFAVVDVWDALRSERPYRAAWPEEKALSYFREQAGTHFDPRVVDAFLEMMVKDPSERDLPPA